MTFLTIIFFPGYYVEPSRPETVKMTKEEMAAVMKKEILEGCDGTDIRTGIIGEIGCCWPLLRKLKRSYISGSLLTKCWQT